MCDVSNKVEASKHLPSSSTTAPRKRNNVPQKIQRQGKNVVKTIVTQFNTIQELINSSNNFPPGGSNVDAIFGRCPPDEVMEISTSVEDNEKVTSNISNSTPAGMTLINTVNVSSFEDSNQSNPKNTGGDMDMTC
jgi:hypothetical protein